jgi:bifunctional DNA-binding transcriptional regulator/antitoxin component of YhaV-PrlF toxin-antitoxin module
VRQLTAKKRHGEGLRAGLDRLRKTDASVASNNNANLHYNDASRDHEELTMTTLTVTTRGQVTFRKEVLQHLGIGPGEKIELDLLPDGQGLLKAARPPGTIDSFVGLLAGRTSRVATLEEINEAAAQGWAGRE